MKVLVTGSSGLVGSNTIKELNKRGHVVIPYDLRIGADIFNGRLLQNTMEGCEAVVHLAGIPHPDKSKKWEPYFKTNVQGTQTAAETAARLGVRRFIFASSTAYYGAHRGFPFEPPKTVGIRETAENAIQRYTQAEMPDMTPYNEAALAYACSKVAAESCLAAYGLARRMEVVILRLNPLIHTREPYEWGLLLYVEKAAAAVADALDLPPPQWYEIYNIANENVKAINMSKWENAHHE